MAEEGFKFMAGSDSALSLHRDPKLALLASCIANQQKAGFKNVIDMREAKCAVCEAPGFNTGWGFFAFTCGAEILNDEEGTPSTSCPHETAG